MLLAASLLGAGPARRSDPDERSDAENEGESEGSEKPARDSDKAERDSDKPESGKKSQGSSLGNWVVRPTAETSFYADTDHVTVVSPTVALGSENPLSGWSFGGSYLVDVVTAASADIVATATPIWREVRHAGSASLGYKPGNFGGAISASASVEPDYLSVTGGGTLTWDLFDKNLTLMLGYGFGHDIAGRSGTPWDVFSRPLDRHQINGGAAWTVNRSTLATLVGDVVIENGDQSKTYRYVPMFAPGTAADIPAGAPLELVNAKRSQLRPLEQLPLSRERFALTGRLAHRFSEATIRLEERLYIDSWSLFASTTDARLIWDVADRFSFGPRARFHVQTGTDFLQRAYELVKVNGQIIPPAIRTGDRELGPLWSATGGLAAELDLSSTAGDRSRVLALVADAIYTSYEDALYLTDRSALFTSLTFNSTFE
jgi:hypothetical protein